jgi:ABC-2 type transport system ATP-binding protein/lipopolysaccharide transport system ATP-binding protein
MSTTRLRSAPMIEMRGVTVDIPTYGDMVANDLRRTIARSLVGGDLVRGDHNQVFVRATNNVRLDVPEGARLGVIGHNGAGKTTLLKVMAGLLPISQGRIVRRGTIHSFFNLGAGLDHGRSGRDNIRAMALYYTRNMREIRERLDEIIEFTELGHYIDLPVSTYSAGMQTRLIFAVATAFPGDVLILDEMIGAGDATFISKAQQRVNELVNRAGCLVLASHSTALIESFCTTAIWMDHGRIVAEGPAMEVVQLYNRAIGNFAASVAAE